MNERHAILMGEIRYAERLTQRTARLYRRAATVCTFLAVVGGSSILSGLSEQVPGWVSLVGVALLGLAGAAALAVRPLEKAIVNETDMRKYSGLRTQGLRMTDSELDVALQKARETDAAEIELLRDVAFNDLLVEMGRDEMVQPLSTTQKLLGAMA